jgi:hypothetical protein
MGVARSRDHVAVDCRADLDTGGDRACRAERERLRARGFGRRGDMDFGAKAYQIAQDVAAPITAADQPDTQGHEALRSGSAPCMRRHDCRNVAVKAA